MRKIILVGAIALLAACGSSSNDGGDGGGGGGGDASDSTASDGTTAGADDGATDDSSDGSDDTITVDNFGDMPPECIDLLATFLKQVEPTVSEIDWENATLAEYEAFSEQFSKESDAFDTETMAAGCDKYNLGGSDEEQFQQMAELAAAEAPGAVGFIQFLASLSEAQNATADSLPDGCEATIAAIEPFLTEGSMQDLTVSEVGVVGQLMGAINTECTPDEASAFFARDDVTTFIGA